MANDGTVKIGVNLDEQEFKSGLSRLGSTASGALSTVTKAAAAALAAATTAVGAFAKSAVETGMQFDATMSKVSAISGAVGGEFEALRDKAIEMGDSTKFSAIEAAEAMTYMGMAGWKAEDMMSGISGIMSLAAAAGEDLATTSDIVTDALTAFGMSASDSAHFADVLAVAATNANTDVGMMGETFKYMAPVAGAMGYSIEDSALAIGLMANSSIKASDAGTALRSIITRLGTNAGATKTQLGALEILTEKLGVEFYNTDGTARDLNSVLMEAREAWKGLGDEQAISYAKTIAGQYAMSGWLAIMNSSDEDVNKLTIALENANGAAEEMAAIMQDNLAGDITMFNSALSTAKITISDQLNPALREFVQFGTTAIRTLNAAFEAGGLSGAMETLGTILSDGIALIMEMLPVMVEAGRQLLGALGQGLLENLPLITDAVVQILMMIVEMLPEMIEAGMQLLEALDQGLLENLQLITDAAAQILLMLVEGILSVLPELATAAIQIVSQLASSISENLPELIPVAVSAILEISTS